MVLQGVALSCLASLSAAVVCLAPTSACIPYFHCETSAAQVTIDCECFDGMRAIKSRLEHRLLTPFYSGRVYRREKPL